ncbi:transporter [Novosphingobium sp. BL-52-GroH]|uniref:transporter n=1 Tax=Novosphingobium sp. BL-52-GroH TaxID=3349877 RepID=UPI00384D9F48
MRIAALLTAGLVVLSSQAGAQQRDYCPDRPGIGTPACTMSPGTYSVELGVGDWTTDRDSGGRTDILRAADVLVRYGVADHAELQVEWAGIGFSRTRDELRKVDHRNGGGDVTLGLRRNVLHPDGSGLSMAVAPFVSLPVGRQPFGAGDWSAGLRVPLSYEVSDRFSIVTTTEFDAAVDEDGSGRHFAASEAAGLASKLNEKLTLTAEYQVLADRDPQGHHVEHLSGLSLGWQPTDDLQLDAGANVGLDRHADDLEVYFGVSRRF